jgi:ABC-type branched-subunit amino acid transport system permease subunit
MSAIHRCRVDLAPRPAAAGGPPRRDLPRSGPLRLEAAAAAGRLMALLAVPAVGSTSTWLTLTVAGLAMGLIIFVIASGLTLVFGLMDVLNFGHGVFIALGAFVATSVMATGRWAGWPSRLQPDQRLRGHAGGHGWWPAPSAGPSSA